MYKTINNICKRIKVKTSERPKKAEFEKTTIRMEVRVKLKLLKSVGVNTKRFVADSTCNFEVVDSNNLFIWR